MASHAPSRLVTLDDDPRRIGSGTAEIEESIVTLLQDLVRIPTRPGIDSYEPIFARLATWLEAHDVPVEPLSDAAGRVVALTGILGNERSSPAYILNATVDTAGFGDVEAWTEAPLGAKIADNWLYGRGSADSKAGIAIFCHILGLLASRGETFPNAVGYVFDADEHNGQFTGIRRFLDHCRRPIAGIMIGYPGLDRIGTGARGFWRATLRIHGRAAHTGSSRACGVNAVAKAARLVATFEKLSALLDGLASDDFPLPARLSVTGIRGGGEFSLVPDSCEVDIDMRLTPAFTAEAAEAEIRASIDRIDDEVATERRSEIHMRESCAPYVLPAGSPLVEALATSVQEVFGRRPAVGPVGPSNVGNFLATRGIEATCGFGVAYRNIHAPDECVEIASFGPTFRVYLGALERLLRGRPKVRS